MLEQIHVDLFPVRYERDFFLSVVNDTSESDSHRDELVGFVTMKIVPAEDSEIEDLFSYNNSQKGLTLAYILMLGVVDHYRNLGIGVYICMSFHTINLPPASMRRCYLIWFKDCRCSTTLKDSITTLYLFAYYVNGHQSPCSLLEIAASFAVHFRGLLEVLVTPLWSNKDQNTHELSRFKESSTLVITRNDARIVSSEDMRRHA